MITKGEDEESKEGGRESLKRIQGEVTRNFYVLGMGDMKVVEVPF